MIRVCIAARRAHGNSSEQVSSTAGVCVVGAMDLRKKSRRILDI